MHVRFGYKGSNLSAIGNADFTINTEKTQNAGFTTLDIPSACLQRRVPMPADEDILAGLKGYPRRVATISSRGREDILTEKHRYRRQLQREAVVFGMAMHD